MALIDVPGCGKIIQHLPIGSLKSFGTNPYDEAIFRVVWSESRLHLVGAKHTDYDQSAGGYSTDRSVKRAGKDLNLLRREIGYRWLPLYPGLKIWILECWKSPVAFTGCTPDQYNTRFMDPETGLLTIGPYPSRGEFCQCFTFPDTPSLSVVHNTIYRIKAGWGHTYVEHKAAVEEAENKKEKQRFQLLKDTVQDKKHAFNNRPANLNSVKSKKEIKLKYSAQDLRINPRGFSSRIEPR